MHKLLNPSQLEAMLGVLPKRDVSYWKKEQQYVHLYICEVALEELPGAFYTDSSGEGSGS
jgi:hypothetical protein